MFRYSVLDEFEVAFRSLAAGDQALLIVSHLGDKEEWEEWLRINHVSKRLSKPMLKNAWRRLKAECENRGII